MVQVLDFRNVRECANIKCIMRKSIEDCIKTHAGGSFHPAQVGIYKAGVCIKTHLNEL
jgi:hypothetical protein